MTKAVKDATIDVVERCSMSVGEGLPADLDRETQLEVLRITCQVINDHLEELATPPASPNLVGEHLGKLTVLAASYDALLEQRHALEREREALGGGDKRYAPN